MMFSKTTRAALAPVLLIAFTFSGSALACSTEGWDSTSGAVVVGQPFGATGGDSNGISRFEELCALRATNTGHVQTNSPSHSEVANRFYVWPNLTGTGNTPLLIGFSAENGTGELFRIGFNGTQYTFATTGGASTTAAAPAGWSLIEYYWDSADDTLTFWINADATMDAPTGQIDGGAGPATLQSVRLGLPTGLGGFSGGGVNFDSFEMHNTTAIGPLLNCDADGNDLLNFNDLNSMYVEQFGGPPVLSPGLPDCDANGLINFNDLSALYFILFPAP